MIHKYLVQVELTPEQAALISPEVLRLDIRRATQTVLAMTLNAPPTVTVVREEMPPVVKPCPCNCRSNSRCPDCQGTGVIR